MSYQRASGQVVSKDGTLIAYERRGSGPALILVVGALCSRALGPSVKLAPLLANQFTVFSYDRRGRGQSGDRAPYIGRPNGVAVGAELVNLPAATGDESISEPSGLR